MTTNNAVNTTLSGQTGTGSFAGSNSPALITPSLDTPTAGILTNCTGYTVANLADVAWTAFTAGWTGFSAAPTAVVSYYKLIGKTCFVQISGTAGTSNATIFTITGLPATGSAHGTQIIPVGEGINAGVQVFNATGTIAANSTVLTLSLAGSTTGWTATGAKMFLGNFFYETV